MTPGELITAQAMGNTETFVCACCGETLSIEYDMASLEDSYGLSRVIAAYGGAVCQVCADDQEFCAECGACVPVGQEWSRADDKPICSYRCDGLYVDAGDDGSREVSNAYWRTR